MKRNLTLKENIVVASMLFGLFFGAGNLIFPVSMGQQAGSQMWPAFLGFFITGVGLPLLGIAALGLSRRPVSLTSAARSTAPMPIFSPACSI